MGRGAERELRRRLRAVVVADAAGAEERAWRVVRAAHAGTAPLGRRGLSLRARLALVGVVAVLAGLALSPAGGAVSGWIDDVVAPGPDRARPSLTALPVRERLLVQSRSGAWLVQPDGARRRLGRWSAVAWSPGGLFVIAARGRELAALDPRGQVRWSLPATRAVTQPRWSPDGYRVAYRSGDDLRVVAGDGSGDRLLARGAGPAAPAWRPGRPPGAQQLAFSRGVRLRIVAADGGRALGVTPPGPPPQELWWTPDGRRLLAMSKGEILIMNARGRALRRLAPPAGLRFEGSALAPGGRRLAMLAPRRDGLSTELLLVRFDRSGRPDRPVRRVFVGPGSYEGLSWSTDGRLLALASVGADRWLFVRRDGRIGAVRGVRARFGAGGRPAGWCYPTPSSRVMRTLTSCSAPGAEPR